jgi:hypothetical protein
MDKEFRRNITPLARKLVKEGLPRQEKLEPIDKEQILFSPEVDQIWVKYKPEYYALSAILIDEFVTNALNDHSAKPKERFVVEPFCGDLDVGYEHTNGGGSISSIRYSDDARAFELLGEFTHMIVSNQITEEVTTLEKSLDDPSVAHPLKDVYQRYRKLYDFSVKYGVTDPNNERLPSDPRYRSLNRGLGTAGITMSTMLHHIPVLHKEQFPDEARDPEKLLDIARNSFGTIGQMAMENLGLFIPFRTENPKNFEIVDDNVAPRLKIKEGAFNKRYSQEEFYKTLKQSPYNLLQGGCPAMVNFGEGSAIHKLWQWHMDLAKPLYTELYGRKK